MDFVMWLRENNQCLRKYEPDMIAYIATLCGFSLSEVCGPISDHILRIKRLLALWESPLFEKWVRLNSYDKGQGD